MNEIIKKYFSAISNKDLTLLKELYHDDVVLWEWAQRIYVGKEQVLQANEELFGSSENLTIVIHSAASESDKHFCELSIFLDKDHISVVDVIVLKDNKILSVQAYRGF